VAVGAVTLVPLVVGESSLVEQAAETRALTARMAAAMETPRPRAVGECFTATVNSGMADLRQ
jgi:hypothetical protein